METENTLQKAKNLGLKYETIYLDIRSEDFHSIKDITKNRNFDIKWDEDTDFYNLQNSIKANGLVEPIILGKIPNKKDFYLLSGRRRMGAIKDLEESGNLPFREIPCRVISCNNYLDLFLLDCANNLHKNVSPYGLAYTYYRALQEYIGKEHIDDNKRTEFLEDLKKYVKNKTGNFSQKEMLIKNGIDFLQTKIAIDANKIIFSILKYLLATKEQDMLVRKYKFDPAIIKSIEQKTNEPHWQHLTKALSLLENFYLNTNASNLEELGETAFDILKELTQTLDFSINTAEDLTNLFKEFRENSFAFYNLQNSQGELSKETEIELNNKGVRCLEIKDSIFSILIEKITEKAKELIAEDEKESIKNAIRKSKKKELKQIIATLSEDDCRAILEYLKSRKEQNNLDETHQN